MMPLKNSDSHYIHLFLILFVFFSLDNSFIDTGFQFKHVSCVSLSSLVSLSQTIILQHNSGNQTHSFLTNSRSFRISCLSIMHFILPPLLPYLILWPPSKNVLIIPISWGYQWLSYWTSIPLNGREPVPGTVNLAKAGECTTLEENQLLPFC